MSMNVSSYFVRLFLKAGAKVAILFDLTSFSKKKFNFLFLPFLVAFAEGKDNYLLPLYPNLFVDFLSSINPCERRHHCGCKSNSLLPISKSFLTYFFALFATNWLIVLCISFIFFKNLNRCLYNHNFGIMLSKC